MVEVALGFGGSINIYMCSHMKATTTSSCERQGQYQGLPNISHIKYPALLLETLVFLVAMSHTE
jgi:hypothetical protein